MYFQSSKIYLREKQVIFATCTVNDRTPVCLKEKYEVLLLVISIFLFYFQTLKTGFLLFFLFSALLIADFPFHLLLYATVGTRN